MIPKGNASLFGIEWDNQFSNHPSGKFNINHLSNNEVGKIYFSDDALQDCFLPQENQYKILFLIYENYLSNNLFFICLDNEKSTIKENITAACTICTVEELISEFPKNIVELQSRILLLLNKRIQKYGQRLHKINSFEFFAEDEDELTFILKSMADKNWLEYNNLDDDLLGDSNILITQDGWMEIEKNINRQYSKQCFIAMSFDNTLIKASESIKKAITDTGFIPLRIDEKMHNNEITGEILFEIRKSRFIIADETGQKNGVYFEAGFALGQGKDVIWCCKDSDRSNLHFDTSHYNHILWKDEEDLYSQVKNRILGTIAIKDS